MVSGLKILIISHRIPFPPNKGEKIRTFNQIRFLVGRGHDVVILSPCEDELEIGYASELEKTLGVKTLVFRLSNKWLRLVTGLLKNEAFTTSYFHNRKIQKALDELLISTNFDAVLCTGSALAPYIFRSIKKNCLSQSFGCRLFMDFMDLDSDKWHQYESKASFPMSIVYRREARLISVLEKRIYEQFDKCFFISENEVNLFSLELSKNEKLQVLGNGIDTDLFFPEKESDGTSGPVFLFTGVMDYRPNEDAVIWFVDSLWEKIKETWPNSEFVIAGMNPSLKIRRLESMSGITVTGYVQDIVPYYRAADIFVAPFRIARGVQNKILQALACGLPVITTPRGLEGINAQDGKEVLVAKDESEFFHAIKRVLEDSDLCEHLSKSGSDLIQREYSWNSALEVLAVALEEA